MSRSRRLPNFLRGPEAELLLVTAQAQLDAAVTPSKRRAAALDLIIIQTGLQSGLRVSELCDLRIEDLDMGQATLLVVQGKGGKDRMLPVGTKLLEVLRAWIAGRRDGLVFPSPRGGRLSERTIQLRLGALGKLAILPRALKPHTLRHTFATRLLERGANIREAQELLGHESVATTEIYAHVAPDRLRGAVERL
jgi:integrase/recombinase XerC